MNQCYKTIFSKVHQCFVVVSELTKSQGKGSTRVNCSEKSSSHRSLRKAAVTLGVAAALVVGIGFGSPAAWADGTIEISDVDNPPAGLNSVNPPSVGTVYYPSDSGAELKITGGNGVRMYGFSGFYSTSADVANHKVTVSGGTIKGNIFGGFAHNSSGDQNYSARDNVVEITGGSLQKQVYGGYVHSGDVTAQAKNNRIIISGGSFNNIKGGINNSLGAVVGNSVTVSGNASGTTIYGGDSYDGVAGGENEEDGNTVTISGGEVSDKVYGGSGKTASTYNKVIINKGKVGTVYGGYSYGDGGTASKNIVTINQTDDATTISGAVYGGYSKKGAASGNTVTIEEGCTVNNNVYGGFVYGGSGAASSI